MILTLDGDAYVDPGVTSRFLAGHASILLAQAWLEGTALHAKVIVDANADVHEDELLELCVQEIGLTHTPKRIMIERANRPAA